MVSLEDIDTLKVAELKELLKERGLAVGGRKAELQSRLREFIQSQVAAEQEAQEEAEKEGEEENDKHEKAEPERHEVAPAQPDQAAKQPAATTEGDNAANGEVGVSGTAGEEAEMKEAGEEPVKAEEEPAMAEEEPAMAEEEPSKVEEEPAMAEAEPAKAEEEPAQVEEEPAQVMEEPAQVEESPAKMEEEPAKVEEKPAKVEEEPAKVEEEPAKVEEDPAQLGEAMEVEAEANRRVAAEQRAAEEVEEVDFGDGEVADAGGASEPKLQQPEASGKAVADGVQDGGEAGRTEAGAAGVTEEGKQVGQKRARERGEEAADAEGKQAERRRIPYPSKASRRSRDEEPKAAAAAGMSRQASSGADSASGRRVRTPITFPTSKARPAAAPPVAAPAPQQPPGKARTLAPSQSAPAPAHDVKAPAAAAAPEVPQDARTKALRVDNLVRPFTPKLLKQLLEQPGGTVEDLWLPPIKDHCYVVFGSEADAHAAYRALWKLQWPEQSPKRLLPQFVPEQEARDRLSGDAPASNAPRPSPLAAPAWRSAAAPPRGGAPGSRGSETDRKGQPSEDPQAAANKTALGDKPIQQQQQPPAPEKEAGGEKSAERKEVPQQVLTLDQLFRKTQNKPALYWLPLTEEEAAQRKAQQERSSGTAPTAAQGHA